MRCANRPKKFGCKVTVEPKTASGAGYAAKSSRCGSGTCTKCK